MIGESGKRAARRNSEMEGGNPMYKPRESGKVPVLLFPACKVSIWLSVGFLQVLLYQPLKVAKWTRNSFNYASRRARVGSSKTMPVAKLRACRVKDYRTCLADQLLAQTAHQQSGLVLSSTNTSIHWGSRFIVYPTHKGFSQKNCRQYRSR